MKYSFRLYLTGQKKKLVVNWGLPLNLQVCPECEALNHALATACVKCSHPLSDPGKSAENPIAITDPAVAPAATIEHGNNSQNTAKTIQKAISDELKSTPSMSMPAGAAASQAAPSADQAAQDMLIRNRRFIMSNQQKWQRRTWGVVFLAAFAIPIVVIVISLLPSPTSSYTTKNPDKNTGSSEAIRPPLAPAPVLAIEPVKEPAAAQMLLETQIPAPVTQSKHAALPPAAKYADKKIAQGARKPKHKNVGKVAPAALETPAAPIPGQAKPATPANTPCSEAAHALALCNPN